MYSSQNTTQNTIRRELARLVWLDMEMTGLDPARDKVLEVAIIITDGNFKLIAEGEPWHIHQPDSILDNMDEWNTRTHSESGLIEQCRESNLNEEDAQRDILRFLHKHLEPHQSPMCGNSICQDRRFMAHYMPQAEAFFHYRNFDVSSFKIAMQLFSPAAASTQNKPPSRHQALDDIRDSIKEMRFYVRRLFSDAGL